jgi:4-hydroxy-tetrahydrodipicolinate synthase
MRGIIPPILTPLRQNRPCLPGLLQLLDRVYRAGCSAAFVGGTAGVGPLLPDADWEAVVAEALAWSRGRCPVLVGVMETSTARAIARLKRLEALGGTCAVITPTFYVTLRSEDEFLRHFDACRAATGLELVVYNIPICTGSAIPSEVLIECFRRGICQTVKDSSGDRDAFAKVCLDERCSGLDMLQGVRADLGWLTKIGAAGLVPVPANIDPEAFTEAWRSVASGDRAAMARSQMRIDAVWDGLVEDGDWISGMAWAAGAQGIGDGMPIAPLNPCAPARRKRIEALIARLAGQAPTGLAEMALRLPSSVGGVAPIVPRNSCT